MGDYGEVMRHCTIRHYAQALRDRTTHHHSPTVGNKSQGSRLLAEPIDIDMQDSRQTAIGHGTTEVKGRPMIIGNDVAGDD
jgi:hypothetical protein